MNRACLPIVALLTFAAVCFSAETPVPEKKAETAPATSPASTAAAGASMPAFPLQSDKYSQIDDNKEPSSDGEIEALRYNGAALVDILPQIKSATHEHLVANVDRDATFRRVFNRPEKYRGHVVQFESTLKFIYDNPEKLRDSQGNVTEFARGHASTSYNPITYLSLEPLPAGMKVGDPVMVTGVFLQRFAYLNRNMPGHELTWTPLIVVKKIEKMEVKEVAPTSNAYLIGNILFAMVAVGLFMLYANRQGYRVARSNVFTRMKREREGGERLFPGPKGNFRKK